MKKYTSVFLNCQTMDWERKTEDQRIRIVKSVNYIDVIANYIINWNALIVMKNN